MKTDWWLNYLDRIGRLFGAMGAGNVVVGVWQSDLSQTLIGLAILAVAVVLCNLELNGRKSNLSKWVKRSYMLFPFGSSVMAGGWGIGEFDPILFWGGLILFLAGVGMFVWDEILLHRHSKAELRRRLGEDPL